MRYRAQQYAKMAKNAIRQPFPAKPEVEIWRKPLFELTAIGFLFAPQYIMGSISTSSGSLLSELYHYAHVNGV